MSSCPSATSSSYSHILIDIAFDLYERVFVLLYIQLAFVQIVEIMRVFLSLSDIYLFDSCSIRTSVVVCSVETIFLRDISPFRNWTKKSKSAIKRRYFVPQFFPNLLQQKQQYEHVQFVYAS